MKRAMEEKGRKMRIVAKMEKILIAAMILIAFVGTVKNRLVFILRNMGDKR